LPLSFRTASCLPGIDTLKLAREEMFVAFAGWDAAGARSFGDPTFWVNRLGLPADELGLRADAAGRDLMDVVGYVEGRDHPAPDTG
jgi:2-haloacid dehalogenase